MISRNIIIACILVCGCSTTKTHSDNNPISTGNQSTQQELSVILDQIFTRYLDSGFSGSAIVLQNGNIQLNKGYGYANDSTRQSNDTLTLFNLASLGKQFTSLSILQLEEKGLLKTSDPISNYIGKLGGSKDSVTIHHLLSHTSGLFIQSANYDLTSKALFLEDIKKSAVESLPGEKHRYSNAGYTLLGMIVEIVSRMPFEVYLYQNIFLPFGMNYTGFPWEERIQKRFLSTGYNKQKEPLPPQTDLWGARGPGHIVTNTTDMYKWYMALQDNKKISAAIKEKLFTNHQPGNESYAWNKGVTARGTRILHKGGGRNDFESQLMYYPDDKVFIFFVINRDYDLRRSIYREILKVMDGYN